MLSILFQDQESKVKKNFNEITHTN